MNPRTETVRPDTAKGRQFIPGLTVVRFFCAVMVVLFHAEGTLGIPKKFVHGIGVPNLMTVFFVLSGFIMIHCYPRLETWRDRWNYWAARIARIWPLHAFAFLLALILVPWNVLFFFTPTLSERMQTGLLNLTMLHAWLPFPGSYASYNSVTWSISVEFFFYLTFPFVLMTFRSAWRRWLVGAASFTGLMIYLSWALGIPGYIKGYSGLTTSGLFHMNPVVRWIEFLVGMALGLAFESRENWAWLKRRSVAFWTGAEVLSFGLLVGNMLLNGRLESWVEFHLGSGAVAWLHHSGSLFTTALLIFVLAQDRGALSRVFGWRPLIVLGESSYALYLLHDPILRRFNEVGHPLEWLPRWAQFPVFFVAITTAAVLSWAYLEIPARKWLMAGWKRWQASRQAAEPVGAPAEASPTISVS